MKRPVYVVDAFTSEPLSGNPAGVVLDSAGLTEAQLQRVAAELNLSETAFPLPARDPQAAFHLRWFAPAREVVFCGHATLASLRVLVEEAKRIRVPATGVVRTAFTCKAGLLHAELSRDEHRHLRVRFETPPAAHEPTQVSIELLTALGLIPEVLEPSVQARATKPTKTNERLLLLCVRDHETLARLKPDFRALLEEGKAAGVDGVVVFALAPAPGVDAAVRAFFPAFGIDEDPVTGMAAGQLALLLQDVRPELLPRTMAFTQGAELGRPGRVEIELRPLVTPGEVRAWIGGDTQVVLRGELELPAPQGLGG